MGNVGQEASLAGGDSTLDATGTITDNDDPTVTASFGQTDYSVDEGGTVQVTVILSADPEREVSIRLVHGLHGGISDADYSGVPASLVFRNGDTENSFTFTAAADDIDDDGESVALTFRTPMPAGVTAGATTTVTITDNDTAGVTISETSLSIDEGATATYTVKLDSQPTGDVAVAIAGHADTDVTLDRTSLTFTADNWNTAQTVTVSAARDDDAASDASVTLTHTANGGDYVDVQETVTVTIVEKGTSVLSVGDAQAVEDGQNVVCTVSISAASGEEVTVDYATSNGTATAGQDYTSTSGTLTFPANSVTSRTVSVPVTDDTVAEAEETFTLTLSNVQGASLAGGGSTLAAIGTITDNDNPTVTANFAQTDYSVDEGGTVEVTVSLSADPEREVTIRLVHGLHGGISDDDYSGVPAILKFQSGETENSFTFTFTAAADDIDDDGESVTLTFRTPMPAGVTAGATTTVTITDDDMAGVTVSATSLSIDEGATATYTVKLDSQPTGDVTVAIAGHSGTDITLSGATLSNDALTFTAENWDMAQTVTVTAGEDDDAVDEEEATLTHTVTGGDYGGVKADDVTVNVTDNDTASPSLDISLPVPTHNDADGSRDVTLNDVLTYTATVTNDGNVPLSGVTLSDLLVDKDGQDCGYLDIGEQCQLTGAHTVTQTDVDAGLVTNSVSADANELTTAVTASQQTRVAQERALALTKTTTTTGFAAVGEQIAYTYTVSNSGTVTLSGTLAISDDKIASTDITCGAVPDGGLVPSESVTCSGIYTVVQADLDADGVTNKASTSLDGVTSNEATATVPWVPQQTDTDPQVSIALAVQVAENGGTVEVAVTLSESGLQTVTVDYATSDGTATAGADYTSASNTLTFAPGTTEQKIRVTVIDDAVDEDEEDETFTVALTNPINASLGNSASTVTITDNDDPAVTASFGQTDYSVDEGGTVEVKVTLSADPEREVTIPLTTNAQGGATSTDYSGVPVSLVFRSGETEKSFTFTAPGDDIDDDGESVALTFRTPMPAGVTAGATTTVTITDNDTAGVTISETSLSIDEGATATYTVKLDTEPTGDVTVAITGHADTDITLTSDALTFTASNWNTAKTVTVTAARDDDAASDAAVTLTHTANGGDYVDVQETVTVTIVEKDSSVLSVSDEQAAENGGNIVFTVSISAANSEAVTVDYATSNGTATAGQDYTSTSGTLTFPANSVASRTISVPVTDDTVDEAEEETFTLTLRNVQSASLAGGGSTLVATGTITDNDDPAVTVSFGQASYSADEGGTVGVTVTLSADPEREVTILLTHDPQGGISDADYSGVPTSLVFRNGDTEKSFTFSATGDDIDDDGESVALGFGALPMGVTADTTATVTITDDDTAGVTISATSLSIDEGATATYTVVLDTEPTASVTVTIAGHSGTDITLSGTTLTNDALTFTADNWNAAQTVTVSAAEDDDTDADLAVTLTHTVAGGDYQGQSAAGVTVTITENDQVETPQPSVTVSFEKNYHNLSEGASGSAGVGLVLSAAVEGEVTIPIVVLSKSTAGSGDYSGVPDEVTFGSGETYTTIWIDPVLDAEVEDDELVWLSLGSLPDGVSAGNYKQTYVRIFDAAHLSFGSSSYVATEGEDDAVVTVRLNKPLPHDVSIPLTAEGGSGATSDDWSGVPQEVTFAAGETEKTFTVTAVDDTVEDDGEMVTLSFGTLSDRLIAVSPATAVVTLMNMEEPTTTHGLPACSDSDPVMVGAVYSGNIETAGQSEWFNFYLEPYKSYVIEIKGVDTGDGTLEDPALLQWRSALSSFHAILPTPSSASGNRNVERSVWVSIPGVHCFEVASGDNGTGTYKLELQVNENRASGGGPDGYGGHDVPADTSTRITTRWDIEATYGYLGDDGVAGDDEDWFRIVLTEGVEYQIDLEPRTHDLEREVVDGRRQERRVPIDERHWLKRPRIVGVHDANGAVIQDTASAGQGMEVSVDFTPPADSAYYILVGSNSGDRTGLFQLCVKVKDSSRTNRCNEDTPQQTETENSPATFAAAHLSFGSSRYVATEGGDDAVVTVRLNKPIPHDVSIPLTAEGGSGATSDDWSGVPQEVTFAAGETEKTFMVTAVDDTVEDDGEMVTLGFGTLSDRLIAVSPATTVVTLMNMEDDPDAADPPVPTSPHCQRTTAAVGSVYTGTIETAGETDWWSVELAPNESYTIHTRGADIEGGGTLPRAETLQFSRSDGGFFTAYRYSTAVGIPTSLLAEFNIWLTKPGIYCFEVGTREANGQGTYRLEVESHGYNHNYDVPADTNTEKTFATPVTRYTSYGFLGDHGGSEPDEDWFRAPLEGGVAYRILLSADTFEEGRHQLTRPRLVGIHHPNGTAIDGTSSTGTGESVSVDFTPPRYGDYYIAVGSNSGDSIGMFVLCARVIAQGDADNCGGRGNSSSGYTPPPAPRNLRVSQGNSQELDVSWKRVPNNSGPGQTTETYGYIVQWKKASDSWDDRKEVTVSHMVPGASYTITGLENGVEYTVRVLAFNFMGVGDASEEVSGSPEQGQETDLQAYNSPATGGPGISGTPRVGETLAATTEGISDEDGLTGAVFGYQWVRHDFGTGTDTDIAGATGTSYTVTSYDAGHAIKVRVSFIDDASNREALTSYAVAAPAPPLTADFPQSPYQSLSHKGADDRPQVIVEFSRAVAAFAKTTPSVSVTGGAVYSVLAHEEDGLEHAWVFFLDPTGTDEIRFSLLTGQSCEAGGICAADGTTLSVAPGTRIIPGLEEEEDETEPQEGQPKKQEPKEPPPAPQNLAAMVNEDGSVTLNWDAPDDDSVTGYQILRRRPTMDETALLVHVEDTGSAATTYTDSDVTEGVRHVYRLKAINATGLSESSNYVNVDPPEREANDGATGAPVISGTVQVGEMLTADTLDIADEDGLDNAAFAYQWLADNAAIAGATGSTYTLADGDEGKTIAVEVSFTDDEGNEEMLTSAATASVAEATQPNNPATGVPTISGTVQVGETLTADTSGIADKDGLDNADFTYQWLAGDDAIPGATGSTYTLADADAGKAISVEVSFTDDAGNGETLISEATDAVAAAPNNPATGAPAISGTAQVGETLTADTSGVADEDGLDAVTFSYQWLAGDSDISGATGSAYTLADADEGKAVKVRVSFTDDGGNDETLTSAATEAVAGNEEPVAREDVAAWSATMTVEWVYQGYGYYSTDAKKAGSLSPASFEVDGSTYTVKMVETQGWMYIGVDRELPFDFVLELNGTRFASGDASFRSYSYGNIYRWEGTGLSLRDGDTVEVRLLRAFEDETAVNSAATGAPTISGTVQVGETLTADTSGIEDADGLDNAAFTYRWLADNAAIAGATGSTHTLADADEGKAITVQVSFTDDAGNDETLTSAATDAVSAAPASNTPANGAPTVSGTAQVGEPLTAGTSGIVDADGLTNATFNYQWLADDADIAGATGSTYTLVDGDEGQAIKVRVSFTDDAGNEEELTSGATDAVAAPEPPAKPTGLSATPSHDRVVLTWDDPNYDTITGYVILRRNRETDAQGQFTELAPDTGTAATTYTDDTVAAETPYTYRIKAINAHGSSERSPWVHVETTAAPAPEATPEQSVSEGDTDLPNDNSTPGRVAVGGSATGAIGTPGDQDRFAVELVAGRTYQFDLTGSPGGGGTLPDTFFRAIYNSAGQYQPDSYNDDFDGGRDSRVTFTPTESGTYYARVSGDRDEVGSYTLSVTDVTPQ